MNSLTSNNGGAHSGGGSVLGAFAASVQVCHRYTAMALNGVSYAVGFVAGRVLCFSAVFVLPQRNKILFGAAVTGLDIIYLCNS